MVSSKEEENRFNQRHGLGRLPQLLLSLQQDETAAHEQKQQWCLQAAEHIHLKTPRASPPPQDPAPPAPAAPSLFLPVEPAGRGRGPLQLQTAQRPREEGDAEGDPVHFGPAGETQTPPASTTALLCTPLYAGPVPRHVSRWGG